MPDDCGKTLSLLELDALTLAEAAVALDLARGRGTALAVALQNNLELWVAIRTFVMMGTNSLTFEAKENLSALSKYVAQKTFGEGVSMSETALDSLIKINLQISEGLLEGAMH